MDTQTRNAPPNDLGVSVDELLPGMTDEPEADPQLAEIDTLSEMHEQVEEEIVEVDLAAPADAEAEKAAEEARTHGWVDKAEWVAQGKPEKQWRTAEAFLDFRAQATPILAKEVKGLREEVARLRADKEIREAVEADAKREFRKEQLRLTLTRAREENDWDAAEKASEELLDLKLEEKTKPQSQAESGQIAKAKSAMEQMQRRYPTLATDSELQLDLGAEVGKLIPIMGNGDPEAVLNKAMERVRRMYPEKFRKPTTAMADTSGTQGGNENDSPSGLGWNDLKTDVRKQYEQLLGNGVTKDLLLKNLRAYPKIYFRN